MAGTEEKQAGVGGIEGLRSNGMMRHLLESLDAGQDVGHYGRLVFAMIARHFLDEDELVEKLCKNPGFDETQAKALIRQVATLTSSSSPGLQPICLTTLAERD